MSYYVSGPLALENGRADNKASGQHAEYGACSQEENRRILGLRQFGGDSRREQMHGRQGKRDEGQGNCRKQKSRDTRNQVAPQRVPAPGREFQKLTH